jgi:hypothetical protein
VLTKFLKLQWLFSHIFEVWRSSTCTPCELPRRQPKCRL